MAKKKKEPALPVEIIEEIKTEPVIVAISPQESIDEFAERLLSGSPAGNDLPSLNDCFRAAVDTTMYLTAVRNKGMVLGSRFVPSTIRAIGRRAAEGNLEASRFLFGFLGFAEKTPVNINTQVNVAVPTLKDVIDISPTGELRG